MLVQVFPQAKSLCCVLEQDTLSAAQKVLPICICDEGDGFVGVFRNYEIPT